MNDMLDRDYLWSATGRVDPEIVKLEGELVPMRYRGRAPTLPPATHPGPRMALAAAATVVVCTWAAWFVFTPSTPSSPTPASWSVAAVHGPAAIDGDALAGNSSLDVGQWLETGADGQVELKVANIGDLTVREHSRLRIVRSTTGQEHRVELARGTIEAFIAAPPRLFFVDTPTAVAVDLGCAYTLAVDDAGNGALDVTLGWVALETGDRSVTVPAGARCVLRHDTGPGTPHFPDASIPLTRALQRIDRGDVHDEAVDAAVAVARAQDRLSLFHLLDRVDETQREKILDRMITFEPLPVDVPRDGVLALDAKTLATWWNHLDQTW